MLLLLVYATHEGGWGSGRGTGCRNRWIDGGGDVDDGGRGGWDYDGLLRWYTGQVQKCSAVVAGIAEVWVVGSMDRQWMDHAVLKATGGGVAANST